MTFIKDFTTVVMLVVLLAACSPKSSPPIASEGKKAELRKSSEGENNLLTTKGKHVIRQGSADKIEFEGSNNVFDLIQKNAAFFDGRELVIIIQGNNNIIKLYNRNVVDMSAPGMDTLLLIGDHVKYVMDVNNKIALKNKTPKADTVVMQQKQFTTTDFSNDFSETDYRIKSLTERLNSKDPEAFYELAKLYHYEVDNKQAIIKAVELYEYAAAQNHVEAIQKLGDLFANGTFDMNKNLKKAQYFFTLGANLGDTYSKERLSELRLSN